MNPDETTPMIAKDNLPDSEECAPKICRQFHDTLADPVHTDIHSLADTLTKDWEKGKNKLSGGALTEYFSSYDPEIADICKKAQEKILAEPMDADVIFLSFLYEIDPSLSGFYKKGKFYESFSAFGEEMLEALYHRDTTDRPYWNAILRQHFLTAHMERLFGKTDRLKEAEALEDAFLDEDQNERTFILREYAMAYLIAGEICFRTEDEKLKNISELTEYMKKLRDTSYEALKDFCHTLVDANAVLDEQLEAFLIAHGKQEELIVWRNRLA